ncbi:hypothetical protein KPH14_008412 [Odynerus spinipes]|uniref:Uncharacterized protein n=1 Tax=Odynerus spinipes TaxID=1348599 RepID=A0AAD9RDY0_9HYME|nr:hypothetical protein KPH14_008412 [Odynerus spinipes]
MKSAIPLQQFKKCIILFMVGTVCSVLAYALYVINPLKLAIEYQLQLVPGSLLYTLWEKPPIDVYLKVFIFNITNPVEFLKGKEKLKLQEVGPYVYQEFLENQNVTFHDNGTITYVPKRSVYYVPELSSGDPEKDFVNVPNIPMLGLSSAMHDSGFFLNYFLIRLANGLDSKPILNITVYDYLWGYDDTLVKLATGLIPNVLNFQKFGLLDRMYDEGENIINMNIRKNNDMTNEDGRYLSIETYNGSPGLSNWGYLEVEGNETRPENTICNRIRGATEGTVFPANLDKRAVFRVFRKAFCRTLPIVFKKEVITQEGIPGYLYGLSEDFLDPPDVNPDNECYCRKLKKCLKKGLSDLMPCYYSILLDGIEGLHPDPEKHSTDVILQPDVGIPMHVNSRMQTNLVMQYTPYNSKITYFNNMTLPLFWTDLTIPNLPRKWIFCLKMILQILPVVQTVVISLLGISGVTMIVLSLVATLWVFNQQQQEQNSDRRDSTDLRIPLGYGQYTAIRILPTIKKITSRTDLFS